METNYLANPVAFTLVAVVCAGFAFLYLWIEPRVAARKIISPEGEIQYHSAHQGWRIYFELYLIVVMTMMALVITADTDWHWPSGLAVDCGFCLRDKIDSLAYNFFQTRVAGPVSAHYWSYITIPLVFWIAWKLLRLDIWRSFLSSLLMIFLHEGVWFIFFYVAVWPRIYWARELVPDVTFLMLLTTFAAIYAKKYGLNKTILIILGPLFLFDFAWYLIGFPVTTTNDVYLMVAEGVTKWYGDLAVNMIEVVGWWIACACTILWLKLNRRAPSNIRKGTDRL